VSERHEMEDEEGGGAKIKVQCRLG